MSSRKSSQPNFSSVSSSSSTSSTTHRGSVSSASGIKSKFKSLFRPSDGGQDQDSPVQVVVTKRFVKFPKVFFHKRRQLTRETRRQAPVETDDDTISMGKSFELSWCDDKPKNFDQYIKQLEQVLTGLRNLKHEDYESSEALKILRFLENLIRQPKEWTSGAKLKLSEMQFPETAMIYMNSYKEKGYLVRQTVFDHSNLLYNAMCNFTDHEFDKEGLIRKQSAGAGFIEFACEILNDPSYRESLSKCYVIESSDGIMESEDFNNYQKILYICDAVLTILYNMANLPELKIYFRECNAINIIAEYAKLSSDTMKICFSPTHENKESISSLKQLQDTASGVRLSSCLLLSLIMNEDEDNFLATNASVVFPLLSNVIKVYNQYNQRFYGFSFVELLDGLSKLIVCGRTHEYVDKSLIEHLLKILQHPNQDESIIECVTNAILNASFDERVQTLIDCDNAVQIIKRIKNGSSSGLVQKNCDAILWTLHRIPHQKCWAISESCQLEGHIMISYNRSVSAMCLKIRDRLKALHYNVWLDVDNINGGVLESMAKAVEDSSVLLICMNEEYKQSYYCRLEAEYATELRKPCIPCLMQPRFRPYGWLGIIKGAKLHVDFATQPFDEAFALLIREVETIRKNAIGKNRNIDHDSTNKTSDQQLTTESRSAAIESITSNLAVTKENKRQILEWDYSDVKNWLQTCQLSNLQSALVEMNGKLLNQLCQMKKSTPDMYYRFLDNYFSRHNTLGMCDILKFDYELDKLFSIDLLKTH